MAIFGNALSVSAATAALDSAEARLSGFEADRGRKAAALAGDLDYDASLALREEIAILDRKVAAATDARQQARRNLDAAQRAAAEAENERHYKAARKLARDGEKLTLEVAAAAERLAGLVTELETGRKAIEAANANRGDRPFIVDGERRVREVPEKVFPTVYEEIDVWRNSAGDRPVHFQRDANGQMVPKDGGYLRMKERFVSRNEYTVAAHIPGGRFVESLKGLMGLKGEALFPTGR